MRTVLSAANAQSRFVPLVTKQWAILGFLLGVALMLFSGFSVAIVPIATVSGALAGYLWSMFMWHALFKFSSDQKHGEKSNRQIMPGSGVEASFRNLVIYILLYSIIWGMVGLSAGIFLVYLGNGTDELMVASVCGVFSGVVWGYVTYNSLKVPILQTDVNVNTQSSVKSSSLKPTDTEETFTVSIKPKMTQEAVRIWYWRMVKKHRIKPMIGSGILGLAVSWLAFHFHHNVLGGILFSIVALALLHIPIFYVVFQYLTASWVRKTPELKIRWQDNKLTTVDGERDVTFHFEDLNYVLEHPSFFLLSQKVYGWLCLPLSDLPGDLLATLRAHPYYELG
jgi:hypothetical protein